MEIKQFPKDRMEFFHHYNRQDLYRMPYSGLFCASMKQFPGRDYLVYIPATACLSTPAVLLVGDEADGKEQFLKESGWMEAADQGGMLLFAVDGDCTGEELEQMIEEIRARDHHVANKSYLYLAGCGTGAARAQRLAMRKPVAFAGLFLSGDFAVTSQELQEMEQMPSDYPGVPLSRVSMPVWMVTDRITEGQQQVVDYWRRANRTQKMPFLQRDSTWYLPLETTNDSLIEELVGGKVRITETVVSPKRIWDEWFSRYLRATGIGNWNLRVWRREEEAGLEFKTLEVDGGRREWYQYIPTVMKEHPEYEAPLVVSLHGGSNLHRSFLPTTEWVKVAEARGFMVVFPAAALRPFPKTNWLPHAAWNASANKEMLDDEKFLAQMLEYLFANYSIDRGRVYASGHSMGSAMGQRVLLSMPQYFAAAGLTSGVLRGGFFGDYQTPGIVEDHEKPIWIIMGERDIGGGTPDTNPDVANYLRYWTKRNKTNPADRPLTYRTGAYENLVYVNEKGVPMACFTTVDNKPHSCTAQDSWFLYDEFFSKFRMDEEGRTVYMNSIVMD